MPATVEPAQTTRVARAGDSISLLSLMPNILQEAVAMAETFRARRGRSSFARATTLKRACATLASMAGAAFLMFTHALVARLDAPDAFAIKDAQIVTGAGKTIAKGTVVFRKGLITDVGESVKIPADARVIDGAGMTVYPGLIDGYTNLGLPTAAPTQAPAGGGRQAAVAAAAAGQQPSPEA